MFYGEFRRVIIERTKRNRDVIAGFPSLCDRAQSTFIDMASALCYCLCYQIMHFESVREILQVGHIDGFHAPLIVDIGSGPATVALAVAERYVELHRQRLHLRYFDVERSQSMRSIADDFLRDATVFEQMNRHSVDSISAIREPQNIQALNDMIAECDAVLIVLSYVLKQRDVDNCFAERVAKLTIACTKSLEVPTFVLIQDISGPPFGRYDHLIATLKHQGCEIDSPARRLSQPHRKVDPQGHFTEQKLAPKNNVFWRYGRIMTR